MLEELNKADSILRTMNTGDKTYYKAIYIEITNINYTDISTDPFIYHVIIDFEYIYLIEEPFRPYATSINLNDYRNNDYDMKKTTDFIMERLYFEKFNREEIYNENSFTIKIFPRVINLNHNVANLMIYFYVKNLLKV